MHWTFEKLKEDVKQNTFNLKKVGLFTGEIKEMLSNLDNYLNELDNEIKNDLKI